MNYSPNGGIVLGAVSTPFRPNDRDFPADVLQRIFDLVILGPVILPLPRDDQRRFLAQTCGRWRDVVTSTPIYWNSIEFVQLDDVRVQRPESLLQLAQVFFRRSGNTIPFFIRFRDSLPSNVARGMLDFVIRSYAPRIWFLSCVVTKSELRTFFGAYAVRFPLLHHIDLTVRNADGSISARTPVKGVIDLSGFQRTLFLRRVALRILDGIHATDLRLPWCRLTQIDLGDTATRASTFMRIMAQSIFLEDGVFCIDFGRSGSYNTTFRTITIPIVRRLRLKLIRPSLDERIFTKLRMPSLQELWLEREEEGQSIRDMTLYEMLLAWLNAPLKHITIGERFFPTTTQFLPRLNWTPRLMYQELDGVFCSAHNLTTLHLLPGVFMHPLVLDKVASGEFLPFLEKLAVSSVSGWDVVWMVQERNLASMSGPSSASLVASMARPVAIDYLDLCVVGCGLDEGSLQELEHAVGALLLPCGYLFRYIDIPGRV